MTLTYLGTHWSASGDLFYLTDGAGNQARVFVDSIGETWVDIRRVPADGHFHTERVESYRVYGAQQAEADLRVRGFTTKKIAYGAHNVRERD